MNSNCKGTATIGNALSTLTMNAGTINVNSPLTPNYSLSFTSGQIGYSSSSTVSGALSNSTYNNLLMGTLTGVYMVSVKSYVSSAGFVGVTTYDFQVGLTGVGEKSRSLFAGTNLNYENNQQTLSMLYSSSGPTNTSSALLYSNVFMTWTSAIGSPIWGITLYYTRVA
jgi:hypothetical protein